MFGINWIKLLPYIGAILAFVGFEYAVYHFGSNHGKSVVQADWDHQKKVDAEFVAKEKIRIAADETKHNDQDRKISDDLATLKQNNVALVATIRGDTALRLQDHARRESVYRVASEGSATERANLASYASQLDRTVAEGIGLVEELQATVAVRDGQIEALASQIVNDRQLIESGNTDGSSKPTQ